MVIRGLFNRPKPLNPAEFRRSGWWVVTGLFVAAGWALPVFSAEPGDTLAAADRDYRHGQYAAAAEAYDRLRAQPAARASAVLGLARCRIATGDYAGADALLADDAVFAKRSVPRELLLAEIKRRVGKTSAALAHARRALTFDRRSCAARLLVGELQAFTGDRRAALATYAWFERLVMRQLPIRADDLTDAGTGFYRYSKWSRDANLTQRTRHVLTQMYQAAFEQLDPEYWPARLAAAELLREKHNVLEAEEDYRAVLAINSNAVAAHVGLGWLAWERWDFEAIERRVERALAVNTNAVAAHNLRAAGLILERRYAAAVTATERALAVNPHAVEALAWQAAARFALGAEDAAGALIERALAISPNNGRVCAIMGDALSGMRRFAESEAYFRKAMAYDATAANPRTELGMMYMQWGKESAARAVLEEAWKLDPFNARTKNTLDLLDRLDRFSEIGDERFAIRFDPAHDEIVARYFARHLAAIYDEVCTAYDAKLARKTIVEIFPTHTEFGVRIHGRPWIHTIGACTGWVIAMDAPRSAGDLPGPYAFVEVLRHEFTHTVTLAVTHNRIPHWFTEGLAVMQEGTPRPVDWARQLADALRRDELYTLKEIDWGFMRPKKVGGRLQAYAQSEWMCEYLIETCGPDVLNRMLAAFAAKRTQAEVFAEVVGLAEGEFDQRFAAWARQQAKPWGFDLSPPEEVAPLVERVAAHPDDADLRARLARAHADAGDWELAEEAIEACLERDPEHRLGLELRVRGLAVRLAFAGVPSARRKLLAEAEPLARRLHALDADNRHALTMLARIHLEREEPDQAVPLLERLREVWPMGMFAVETLAKIHYDAGRFEEALPLLDIVAQQRQSHPDTWRRMGDIHERAGRLDAARTAYDRGLFIDPLDEQLHLSLAEIAMRQRDWPNAVTAYRTLCKIAPRSADYHSRCALAYRALGDNKNMREFAERAVRIDPAASAAVLLEH
jgi:tetratricopeptide (TPR) repeat protein